MNQSANFTSRTFEVSHFDMASDASVLAAIGQVVGAPVDPTSPSGGISPSNIATLVIGLVLLAVLVI